MRAMQCGDDAYRKDVREEVRKADTFSVNPGLRLGLGGWRGMHRIAVPLSDGRHCCKARQQLVLGQTPLSDREIIVVK